MGIFRNIFKRKSIDINQNFQNGLTFVGSNGAQNAIQYSLSGNKQSPQNNSALLEVFNNVAEVSIPVRFISDSAAQIRPNVMKYQGAELVEVPELDKLKTLLASPNALQNWNEFYAQVIASYKLFGNYFIYAQGASILGYPLALWVLPAQYVTINVSKDSAKAFAGGSELQILSYSVLIEGTSIQLNKAEVLHGRNMGLWFKDGAYLYGASELLSCEDSINSIIAGRQTKKGIYTTGAAYLLTPSNTGGEASVFMPFEAKDALRIQGELNEYGLTSNQKKYMVSNQSLNVTRISHNIAELQIDESNITDFRVICRALGVPVALLSDTENSTYNNVEGYRKQFFRGAFLSLNNQVYNDLSIFLSGFSLFRGYVIRPDYRTIPELQDDLNSKHVLLWAQVSTGLITRNMYLTGLGSAAVDNSEFDEYYTYGASGWISINNEVESLNSDTEENGI